MILRDLLREAMDFICRESPKGGYAAGFDDGVEWFYDGLVECEDLEIDDEE